MDRQLATEHPHVYRLALRFCRDRHLAEDLTQETMLKAMRKQDQLKSPRHLRMWLFQILANTWRDHGRRSARSPQTSPEVDPIDTTHTPADEAVSHQEHLELALDAMDSLPEKQRAVLHLFAVESMSLAEIAEVLGMKRSTVKVNLCHARRTMRTKLPEFAPQKKQEPLRPLR